MPDIYRRVDESSDAIFYAQPRLVAHLDDGAIRAVTQLYRERLPVGGAVLDLMSSWISHLPADVAYNRVAGLGMNHAELAANVRLSDFVVHDLNADPTLPYDDATFDAAACCVSIDYLTRPIDVCREVARALRPGGTFVVTFSNRCFPTKAIAAWHALDSSGRVALVAGYLRDAGFADVEPLDRSPPRGDPLWAVVGGAPPPGRPTLARGVW